MEKIIKNVNETFDRFSNVGPWFLRITLGISFLSYGYAKFPLPSEMLISFGFTKLIAVFVPLVDSYRRDVRYYSDWFYERIMGEIKLEFCIYLNSPYDVCTCSCSFRLVNKC